MKKKNPKRTQIKFEKIALWFLIIIILMLLLIFIIIPKTYTGLSSLIDDLKLKDTIRFEIIKALLQVLFVAIIGGLIAYLYKRGEERNKSEEARKAIRTDYLKRLGNIYRRVKEARRILRAGGLTSEFDMSQQIMIEGKLKELYFQQMEAINKYQLELEELKIEASYLPPFLKIESLNVSLLVMEDYLRQILIEYERTKPKLDNGQKINFITLNRLNEFTGSTYREFIFQDEKSHGASNIRSPFKTLFSNSYSDSIEVISENLGVND